MIRELIDMELDAVAGGRGPFVPHFPSLSQTLTQTNTVTQTATASGGDANNAVNAIGAVGNGASQFALIG